MRQHVAHPGRRAGEVIFDGAAGRSRGRDLGVFGFETPPDDRGIRFGRSSADQGPVTGLTQAKHPKPRAGGVTLQRMIEGKSARQIVVIEVGAVDPVCHDARCRSGRGINRWRITAAKRHTGPFLQHRSRRRNAPALSYKPLIKFDYMRRSRPHGRSPVAQSDRSDDAVWTPPRDHARHRGDKHFGCAIARANEALRIQPAADREELGIMNRKGHHSGGRPRNAALSADVGDLEAVAADLRQAADLLLADDADAGRHPRIPHHHHAGGDRPVQAPARRRQRSGASNSPMPSRIIPAASHRRS